MREDSRFFKDKCIDMGNSRVHNAAQSKYKITDSKILLENICDMGNSVFKVESETNPDKMYNLSMSTGYCSCPRGATRAPCKHKDAVSKHFGIANFTTMPTYDAQARKNYLFIATGTYFDDTFLRPFCPTTTRTATTTSTSTIATSTVTTSVTLTVSSSASVSLLNTIPTSSPISETNLSTMISTARATVSNDLRVSDNDDNHDHDVDRNNRDDDRDEDDDDRDDNDGMDEAFIAGDEETDNTEGKLLNISKLVFEKSGMIQQLREPSNHLKRIFFFFF